MHVLATISTDSRTTAGVLLLTIVAVEWGGLVVLRIARGQKRATPFQERFARAGHAHAAVLVVFAIVAQMLVDETTLSGVPELLARAGIWIAAILFPLGFFLSSAGPEREQPSRLIGLLYLGVLSLTAGVVSLGVGLIAA